MGGLLPRMLMLNTVDCGGSYPVCFGNTGKGFSIAKVGAYFVNFLVCQFCLMVFSAKLRIGFGNTPVITQRSLIASCIRPALSLLSAFFNHIGHIFCVSASNKMVRVDATTVVAGVHDTHTVRNRPVKQMIRNPVAHPNSLPFVFQLYGWVATSRNRMLPFPATIFRNGVSLMKPVNKIFNPHNNFSGRGFPHYTEVGRIV